MLSSFLKTLFYFSKVSSMLSHYQFVMVTVGIPLLKNLARALLLKTTKLCRYEKSYIFQGDNNFLIFQYKALKK